MAIINVAEVARQEERTRCYEIIAERVRILSQCAKLFPSSEETQEHSRYGIMENLMVLQRIDPERFNKWVRLSVESPNESFKL